MEGWQKREQLGRPFDTELPTTLSGRGGNEIVEQIREVRKEARNANK